MTITAATTAAVSDPLAAYVATQKTSSTSSSSKAASSGTSVTGLGSDFNVFLKLLTTQLKDQDPTNAMDANTFTTQLVQFASVEQQINANTNLQKIVSTLNPNGISPLLGYMNQYVEATSSNNTIEVQSGQGVFTYTLPSAASNVQIAIKNSAGKTVTTLNGPTVAGTNRVVWDGKDSSGTQLADGTYSLAFTAKDKTSAALPVSDVRLVARITGLETATNGTGTLVAGGIKFKDTDVKAVYPGA